MVGRIDDTPGVPTRGEPSILIPDSRQIIKGKPDRHVLGCDLGELYLEGMTVLFGSLEVVTASERVELPDELPAVLGSLGPLHICERRADVLGPLSGVNVIISDGDIVVVDDAVGIK